MRTSIFITATSAVLAIAGPVEKRKYVTEIQTHYEMVTVTEGWSPEATPVAGIKHRPDDVPVEAQAAPDTEVPVVVTTTKGSKPEPEPTNVPVVTVFASQSQPKPSAEASTTKKTPENEPNDAAPADDDFQGLAIYHHNLHRANHSVPEVSWNGRIAGYAGTSAAECVFKHDM